MTATATRWFNPSQPQTLQFAVMLLYFNGAVAVLFSLLGVGFLTLFSLLGIGGAYGIANEKKWGYYLSVVVAMLPLAFSILGIFHIGPSDLFSDQIINLIFRVALVVLLLHPMSHEYQRIWFK